MAGRKAGTPNRNKGAMLRRLKEQFGQDFDPIMKMAENAVEMQKLVEADNTIETRKTALDSWDKLAQYLEPKLKAIEVTTDAETLEDRDAIIGSIESTLRRGADRATRTDTAPGVH